MPQDQTLLNWVPPLGSPHANTQFLRGPQEPTLRTEVPALYGLLAGLAGSAPDSLGRGSVLDPEADVRNAGVKVGADLGFGLSSLAQIIPGLGPLFKGINLAKRSAEVPSLAGQRGAISLGGDRGLVLTHAFRADRGPDIANTGLLAGPSMGVSLNQGNAFRRDRPQMLFRAGAIAPEEFPHAVHVNRDGYFPNPRALDLQGKFDPKAQEAVFQSELKRARAVYGPQADQRMFEFGGTIGDSAEGRAHTLQIMASPNFKDMRAFEEMREGAGALSAALTGGAASQKAIARKIEDMGLDLNDLAVLYRRKLAGEQLAPEYEKLWQQASRTFSAMSELKLPHFAQISPENTSIYLPAPQLTINPESFQRYYKPFLEKGYNLTTEQELMKAHGQELSQYGPALANIPNAQGGWTLPPRLSTAEPVSGQHAASIRDNMAWLADFPNRAYAPPKPKELEIPSFTGRQSQSPPSLPPQLPPFQHVLPIPNEQALSMNLEAFLKHKASSQKPGLKIPSLEDLLGPEWLNK